MLRSSLLWLLVLCSPAFARPLDDVDFRAWAKKRVSTLAAGIESWGVVQLDDDPALEHFAVVCAEDSQSATVLLVKSSDAIWSVVRPLDGRNRCTPDDRPAWSRPARRGYELEQLDSDGFDSQTIGLRDGKPILFRTDSSMEHSHEHVDFEVLRRTRKDCDKQPCVTYTSAVFMLGGAAGTYRSATPHATSLDVTTSTIGKRAAISVALSRSSVPGDVIEVWSTSDGGRPMGWRETWGGTSWKVSGVGHAPKELPSATGDAAHVTVPIVRRELDGEAEGTALCVVWYAASGAEHTSTCDLDGHGVPPFFFTMSASLFPPEYRSLPHVTREPR